MGSPIRLFANDEYIFGNLPTLIARGLHDDAAARARAIDEIKNDLARRVDAGLLRVNDPVSGQVMKLGDGGVFKLAPDEIFITRGVPAQHELAKRGLVPLATVCNLLDEYEVEWQFAALGELNTANPSSSNTAKSTVQETPRGVVSFAEADASLVIEVMTQLRINPFGLAPRTGNRSPWKDQIRKELCIPARGKPSLPTCRMTEARLGHALRLLRREKRIAYSNEP